MWEKLVKEACIKTGLIDPAAAVWIAPIVERGEREGLGYQAIARQVRNSGEQLSADEKRALGMRANTKATQKYIGALTPRGREKQYDSAFLVVQRAVHQHALGNPDDLFNDEWIIGVEICAVEDSRTCAAAAKLDGRKFPKGHVPPLPLPECDAEYCRCLYLPVMRS
jgi:hypothetical protein